MEDQRLKYLFNRYLGSQLSEREQAEWLEVLTDPKHKNAIDELVDGVFEREDLLKFQLEKAIANELLQAILNEVQTAQPENLMIWKRFRSAAGIAAAVATIVLGVWFFTHLVQPHRNDLSSRASRDHLRYANDIAPGKNGATITLSTGQVIPLSSNKTGIIISPTSLTYDDNTQVIQNGQGTLMMTASTARGQTYTITLPDGSKVWLNAASSLRFPTGFANKSSREVELKGEGYFEIAKDKAHPFVLKTGGQQLRVLGTHFNVNAYMDEANIKTTLLEGSVAVSSTRQQVVLKPGEQVLNNGTSLKAGKADTDLAIAWKNNEFNFESESIETLMKMVERWYDVQVVYAGEKTTEKFSGRVSRFQNVSELLRVVESTGYVHFDIQGRTIYVTK